MLIPKFEYGEPIYTMEVVLPSGEILRTGSAAGLGSIKSYQADQVGPYGPGIDFARLFQSAQGTLGVVTSMNVKAEPLPRIHRLFFATFDTLDRLVAYMYAVQRRLLGYECFALNAFNLATILAEKWPEDFRNLRKVLPPWCLMHCLGGTVRLPEEKVAYEEEDLKEVAQGFGVDLKSHIPDVTSSETIISKYLRRPWDSEPYWKDRYRGGCSDIFFYTTLDRTEEFTDIILGIAKSYDRDLGEIGTYIQPIEHGRACHLEFNIPYNPAKPDETKTARAIHDEACRELVDKGAFFTRPYGSWADAVYNKSVGYSLVSKQMKAMFDPNNIMNPGRLCF
jgi:FAD/FMN-containing dehydrogenase